MANYIDRQAAIDALCNDYCGGHQDCKYYPNCENLKSIEQLPSAQPEILACGEGELNVPDINVGDMISRQAVINAIDECYCGGEDSCGEPWIYRENAVEAIQMIEPIQPKTAKRIIGKSRGGMTLWYQCNVCNEPVDEKDAYCRGCGRRLIDG